MQLQILETSRPHQVPHRRTGHWLVPASIIAVAAGLGAWRLALYMNRSHAGAAAVAPAVAAAGSAAPGVEDWRRLASLAGDARLAAVAVRTERPVQPDGRIGAEEWADAFRVTVPGGSAGVPADLEVRCLWNDRQIAVGLAGPMPPEGSAGWRLVLCMDGCEDRFQFDCPRDGAVREYHLARDARQVVEPPGCRGAMSVQGGRTEAEWLIPAEPFRACLTSGRGVSITIRSIPDTGSDPQAEDPPLYWLLSSLAGVSIDLVTVDPARLPWPALAAGNCLVDPGGVAIQWHLARHDLAPGEGLSLPLQIRTADEAGDSFSLSYRLTTPANQGVVPLEPVVLGNTGPDAPRLRQTVLRLRPAGRSGMCVLNLEAKVGQADPSSSELGLLVHSDVTTALRKYLLLRRDHIEQVKEAPVFDASVARAHVVRCLQLADPRRGLTASYLAAVRAMETAIAELRAGRVSTIPLGRSQLLWRCPPGPDVNVILQVPEHYDPRLAWPLLASCTEPYAHPAIVSVGIGAGSTTSLAGLLGEIERLLRIDGDRVYLAGQCEGAYQATDLLVTSPDRWAAAVLGARAKWSLLWLNASHVPVRCYCNTSVKMDWLVTRAAIEWMRQQGCRVELIETPDVGHMVLPARYQRQLVAWCLGHSRGASPGRVRLCSVGGQRPSSRWLCVDDVQDASRVARIEAVAEGATLSIRTEGVTGYSVDLAKAPIDPAAPTIRILENGAVVARVPGTSGPSVYKREVAPASSDDGPLLATVRREHPDWQWQQWAASVACRYGRAQGMVADRLLKGSAAGLAGPIHARHIHAYFDNHWIVRGHFTRAAAAGFLDGPPASATAPSTRLPAGARPLVRYVCEPPGSATSAADPADEYILLAPNEAGRTAPGMEGQPLPAWWPRFLEAADRCELQEQFLADDLVRFLAENPAIDLDAVLSAQRPPALEAAALEGLREVLP